MLYAGGFGGVRRDFVSRWNLGAAVDEEESIDSFERRPQRRLVGEIADGNIDAFAETGAGFVLVPYEDSRPFAILNQTLHNLGADVTRRAGYEIDHWDSFGELFKLRICINAHYMKTRL